MSLTNCGHRNRVLAGLQPEDLKRFFSDLHPVSLALRHVIQAAGAPLEYVYFIEEGVASVLATMLDGARIEIGMIGMIGIEGVVGIPALFGAEVSSQHVIIQIPVTALRLTVARFRTAFNQSEKVRSVMLRFADSLFNLSAQTAACSRLHSIEQRCARWLLMAHARHGADVIPMTHEFMSSMLGVRRAGIFQPDKRERLRRLPDSAATRQATIIATPYRRQRCQSHDGTTGFRAI